MNNKNETYLDAHLKNTFKIPYNTALQLMLLDIWLGFEFLKLPQILKPNPLLTADLHQILEPFCCNTCNNNQIYIYIYIYIVLTFPHFFVHISYCWDISMR